MTAARFVKLVIGARGDDDQGFNAGAVYVYQLNASGWKFEQKLVASDAHAEGNFGWTVALDDGVVVVTSGVTAYVFAQSAEGAWGEQQKLVLGHGGAKAEAADIHAGTIAVGDVRFITTFVKNGELWVQEGFVDLGSKLGGAFFRTGLAIHGDRIVHGNSAEGGLLAGAGSAQVLARSGSYPSSSWVIEASLSAPQSASAPSNANIFCCSHCAQRSSGRSSEAKNSSVGFASRRMKLSRGLGGTWES